MVHCCSSPSLKLTSLICGTSETDWSILKISIQSKAALPPFHTETIESEVVLELSAAGEMRGYVNSVSGQGCHLEISEHDVD